MIYTVTLNPTLDITYSIEEMSFGEPMRALEVEKSPGGKGLQVSRALRSLGMDSVAIGLMGGYIGDEVLDLLQKEGLILQVVKIESDTRTNVIVLDRSSHRELSIWAPGPPLDDKDADTILELISSITVTPEVIVLAGSLPPGMRNDIYYTLVNQWKAMGTKVILDSKGEPMRHGVEAGPYMIKPNRRELEQIAGREFADDEAIMDYCDVYFEKGISVVLVSMGKDGALMVTPDGAWRGHVPSVSGDTVGAGDSTVAGFVMGITRSEPLDTAFLMGLASGVSTVMTPGSALCNPISFERVQSHIQIEKVR